MAGIGQKRSLAGVLPNVRFPIETRTFEVIAAAQNDLFVGHVGLAIPKRKKSANSDFEPGLSFNEVRLLSGLAQGRCDGSRVSSFLASSPVVSAFAGSSQGAVAGMFAGCLIALSGLRLADASARLKLLLATFSVAVVPYLLAKMHDRYFFIADVFAYLLMFAFPRLWPVAIGFQVSSTLAYSSFLFGFKMGQYLGAIINGVILVGLAVYILREFGAEMGMPRVAESLNRLTKDRAKAQ